MAERSDLTRRRLDAYIRECIDAGAWPTAEQVMHIVSLSPQERGTPCETADCQGRAERYVSCEGEGAYPYCRDCADLLMRHGETDNGSVRDPVVLERDRYRDAIETAMRHLGKVPCDAPGLDLCPACEAQITLRDALEHREQKLDSGGVA